MDPLIIPATSETPAIDFNAETGIFKITGESYPENVNEFYGAPIEYMRNYISVSLPVSELHFSLTYFNTATSKIIVKLVNELNKVTEKGNTLHVKWHCDEGDESILEKGEELKDVLDAPFEIVINGATD